MLELASRFPLPDVNDDVIEAVEVYIANHLMPIDPGGDAFHLAVTSFHQCDFLVTWNCRHIANARQIRSHPPGQWYTWTEKFGTGIEMAEAPRDNITAARFVRNECPPAERRFQISAIHHFHPVAMSARFNGGRRTTPASVSAGMIAPAKIQVTSFRPLDKLPVTAFRQVLPE